MSSGAIIAIVIAAVVVLGALAAITIGRGRDVRGAGALTRETRQRDKRGVSAGTQLDTIASSSKEVEQAAADARNSAGTAITPAGNTVPVPWVAPDPEVIGATRRHFLNVSMVSLMGISLASFGGACLAFLYPKKGGGFGSKVAVGKLEDIVSSITANGGFYYFPAARTWITAYPKDALPKASKAYAAAPAVLSGQTNGINALYQKCPHLGCRVPNCPSSQWFECPCHGSQYNRVGEKKAGPAPRGMDRFGVSIVADNVTVDTAIVVLGPPIGTNTTGQEAEGPHCVGGK